MTLRGSVLFEVGQTSLSESGRDSLDRLVPVLLGVPSAIRVEGHSDASASGTDPLINWNISAERAVSVARFLIGRGLPPERIQAVALADTRPIGGSDPSSSENRRVILVLGDFE